MQFFVSYRRTRPDESPDFDSIHLARHVKDHLTAQGHTVFLDVDGIGAGPFPERLRQEIRSADWFVIVVSADSHSADRLSRTGSDWVREEIAEALRLGSRINFVVVTHGEDIRLPEREHLPEVLQAKEKGRQLDKYTTIAWTHPGHESFLKRLSDETTRAKIQQRQRSYEYERFLRKLAQRPDGVPLSELSRTLDIRTDVLVGFVREAINQGKVAPVEDKFHDYTLIRPPSVASLGSN